MRDHLTEIPPSRCVIGLSQHPSTISCLIVADWRLHYILQYFTAFPPDITMTQRASFPLGWTPLRAVDYYEQDELLFAVRYYLAG